MISVWKKLHVVIMSSTETEVVLSSKRFPKCIWFGNFQIAQGRSSKEDLLYKDNKSCIQLHKNYPFSIGKESKNIKVRYFFIINRIGKKDVKMI